MEHREFKHIAEDAKVAIIFVHGIAGTPNHFSDFIECVPKHISVHNLLLDGHGKNALHFSQTSMKKWETQVQVAVDELLLCHKKIYFVAHSMGTLFAIEQATRRKEIAGLFLLAVPIKLFLKPRMFSNALKTYFGIEANITSKYYGIEQDKNPFHFIGWIPRYLELFAKIRQIRKVLHLLNTPCTAYQSSKDETVAISSVKYLRSKSKMAVNELEESSHYHYSKEDLNFLLKEFKEFIKDATFG